MSVKEDSKMTSYEIENLKKELSEKEKNLMLAATYGKELLDQNADLHTRMEEIIKEYGEKLEELEQQKYSISLKLESKEGEIKALHSEIEQQENLHQENMKKVSRENQELSTQLTKKIMNCEMMIESLQREAQIKEEQIKELQQFLEETQRQQHDQQLLVNHNASFEESTNILHNQIALLTSEKQNLEKDLSNLKSSFKSSQLTIEKQEKCLQDTQAELEEKECKLTSMFNIVGQIKEEKLELQMELDNIKMAEADPRKKGNSLFAEVEDHRQALEKRILSQTSSYNIMKRQYEVKSQQIAKMKLQIASLLCLSSSGADLEYQKNLENSLESTKSQLDVFARRCKELEDQIQDQQERLKTFQMQSSSPHNDKNNVVELFKKLYEESQKIVQKQEEEMKSMRFNKISLSDQILQMQRKLYRAEKEKDSANGELIQLRVKLDELSPAKSMDPANKENGCGSKRVTERLPIASLSVSQTTADTKEANRSPLVERFVRVKTHIEENKLKEVDNKVEEQSSSSKGEKNEILDQSVEECDKGNEFTEQTQEKGGNKVKKSVKMMDTVFVYEENKVQNVGLNEDVSKKLTKNKRSLKKMEGVHIKESKDASAIECKQQ